MRTADFSHAPPAARAGAVFYGGTQYSGPRALLGLGRRWLGMQRVMRRAPGYLGHHPWYRFPFTIGTVSFWETREHLLAFARTPAHREATAWMMRPGIARAAFIRYYSPLPSGNTVGEWSTVERALDLAVAGASTLNQHDAQEAQHAHG